MGLETAKETALALTAAVTDCACNEGCLCVMASDQSARNGGSVNNTYTIMPATRAPSYLKPTLSSLDKRSGKSQKANGAETRMLWLDERARDGSENTTTVFSSRSQFPMAADTRTAGLSEGEDCQPHFIQRVCF